MSDYKKDLRVGTHTLDTDWIEQAGLYAKYAEMAAEAVFEKDKAKQRLDIVKAEVDADVRQYPENYGFNKKPTETAISNAVTLAEPFQKAYSNYIAAKREADLLSTAKTAFEHRKKALEGLTHLFNSNYFQSEAPNEINPKRNRI